MKKLTFAILGAGFGERVIYPCISYNKNMEVKYIYCRSKKKIKNRNILKKVTTDYKKIFNDKDVDIICIETPPSTHKFFAMEAIKKNKGIICEKPLALNLKEAKTMVDGVKNIGSITITICCRSEADYECCSHISLSDLR